MCVPICNVFIFSDTVRFQYNGIFYDYLECLTDSLINCEAVIKLKITRCPLHLE